MNKYDILFPLSAKENIVLELGDPMGQVDCCYRARICLVQEDSTMLLSDDTVLYNMQMLSDLLKRCLSNELQLHQSITNDIGYLYNGYYQDESKFIVEEVNNESTWVGDKNYLWFAYANKVRLVSWLYNDKEGNIIFEVTPFYPYLYADPEDDLNYIAYEEWIKDYTPCLVKTISKEIAQQWLEQANSIVEQININLR